MIFYENLENLIMKIVKKFQQFLLFYVYVILFKFLNKMIYSPYELWWKKVYSWLFSPWKRRIDQSFPTFSYILRISRKSRCKLRKIKCCCAVRILRNFHGYVINAMYHSREKKYDGIHFEIILYCNGSTSTV